MKRIVETGAYKSGDLTVEVVGLTDLEEPVNENTAVFVDHTMVTSRIGGQDFSDSYQFSRALLQLLAQWRVVASQSARVAKPHARAPNHVRRAAA